MSAPTRGMVAGQAITTQAQTKEFDEGYDRIFGPDRKPVRGRFVYDAAAGGMVEVGVDWEDPGRPTTGRKSEDEIYGNLRATDGADISSRKKQRDYMRANNVTHADDYSPGYWEKASKERVAKATGQLDGPKRRELIHRALERRRK